MFGALKLEKTVAADKDSVLTSFTEYHNKTTVYIKKYEVQKEYHLHR